MEEEEIDVDEIAEVNYLGDDASTVDVVFKDGTSKRFDSVQHPEILSQLNHWTPPTA